MAYWLMKSEPGAWSWEDQVRDSVAGWDGVRKIGPDVHRRAHSPAKGSPTKGRGAQMAFEAGWME